jgi:hypothetical protein
MQKDPFIHTYRSIYAKPLLSLLILVIVIYLYILFLTNLLDLVTIFSLMPWQFFFCVLLLFCALCYISLRKQWGKHTALRQRALSADPTVLATPQPTPNLYNTLLLPTTIILQPDLKRLRRLILRQAISLLIVLSVYVLIFHGFDSEFFYFPFFTILIPAALVPPLIWISKLRYARSPRAQQRIEVTEQGLAVSYQGKISSIPWQDARLFTINGFNQPRLPLFYELSGKRSSLLWMQVRPGNPRRQFYYLAPTIPFEEYTNKMQALHALIATHTQLPLYNLHPSAQTTPSPTVMAPQ